MGTAASSVLNPIAAELEDASVRGSTAKALSRRARQRRQIQAMIAASYVIDALVLLIYAYAGTIPSHGRPGLRRQRPASVAFYLVLSETGITERFKDHYFVVPQSDGQRRNPCWPSSTSRPRSA